MFWTTGKLNNPNRSRPRVARQIASDLIMGDQKTPKRWKWSKRRKQQLNVARSKRLCREGNTTDCICTSYYFSPDFIVAHPNHCSRYKIIAADITATNEDVGSSTLVSAVSHLYKLVYVLEEIHKWQSKLSSSNSLVFSGVCNLELSVIQK